MEGGGGGEEGEVGTSLPLYICIENFKNLLVRNYGTDFNIIYQKCSFGGPVP